MLKSCAICGKSKIAGRSIARKGLAKKKGGTGRKITRVTTRTFHPNLQKMRILVDNRAKRIYICAKCIKKGAFKKV